MRADEAGSCGLAQPRGVRDIIRIIHIVWIGDETRRPDNCIETWRRLNPAWVVRVWGNAELKSLEWRNAAQMRRMLPRELCGVADMMRWEILDRHGGFAMDADGLCLRGLEDWLFEPDLFACWESEIARPGLIANGYVYARPGNGLVRQIIQDIGDTPDITAGRAWQLTGPKRLTDTFRRIRDTGLTVYPSHYFMPSHLTGVTYTGSGPVFARQLWGSTQPRYYDDLAQRTLNDLVPV